MKTDIIPCSKEEIDKIILEAEKKDEFDYMLYMVLKTTGRRIGELYGVEEKQEISRRVVGKKTIWVNGQPMEVDRTIPKYKTTNNWKFGVQVKDIDFEKGIMKVWVLKRRQYVQDETVLLPNITRILSQYVKKNKLNLEDYIFRKQGRGMRQIRNTIQVYAKRAGIEHSVSIHNFRHYFVTELKRQGWSNDQISKLTGHKTVSTLAIYDHILATDLKEEAIEAIKNL